MALTEEQRRWNLKIEEEMKKTEDIKYVKSFPKKIQDIYEQLKKRILQIDQKNITIVEKSNYISFKVKNNNKSFVDVQLQKFAIKCIINVKFGILRDPKKISRNISKLGHFGSGDYEGTIKSSNDINLYVPFIIQSYRENS